jgi:2-keto-4-pentenoate hydratase/2-oxohepta-3-ene-1,7-dioic acid hydratase in catechol pathway
MFPPEGAAWGRAEIGGRALVVVRDGEFLVTQSGERHARSAARLLPPVLPSNFYAAGLNYRSHIDWVNREHGGIYKVPTQSDIGTRAPSALVGSGADLVIPADSPGPVHYEGELVAVIGRSARGLAEQDALSCVAGYTLGNDVSERSWQRSDRTLWRAKNCDTFKPMGPFVVPGLDPMAQSIEVRINGRSVSRYTTQNMIFSLAQMIARLTRYVTLHPGDVIWCGCDGPTEPALQPGDLVEVVNDAIGVLANRVVRGAR